MASNSGFNEHATAASAVVALASESESGRLVCIGQATIKTRDDIPLDTISLSTSASTQQEAADCPHDNEACQNGLVNASTERSATSDGVLTTWLWGKGYIVWGLIMSIIMLALTAATYVVTKFQSSASSSQGPSNDWLLMQEWQNKNEYYKYCKAESEAGKSLSSDCETTLEQGLSPPPHLSASHTNAKRSQSEQSNAQTSSSRIDAPQLRGQDAFKATEARVSSAKRQLSTVLPSHVISLRGIRRRFVRLFRGGRRLGTGRQTYGLPTYESGLSALSLK